MIIFMLAATAGMSSANADEPRYVTVDGIKYEISESADSDTEAIVAGLDGLQDVVIPAAINVEGRSINVTGVDENTVLGNQSLHSIVFGANITEIPAMSQSSVESVRIEGEVAILNPNTFMKCSALKNVELPESIRLICSEAFEGCTSLTSIDLPDNLETIGWDAFCGSGLRSIVFPESLKMIDEGAFSNCANLTDIDFGKGVSTVGHYAFKGCGNLSALTLPENIVSVGNGSFSDCGIKYVTFGNMSYAPVVSLESSFGTSEFPYTQAISFNMVGDFPNPYPTLLGLEGKRHLTVDSPVPVYMREATDDASVRWPVGNDMVVSMSGTVNTDDPEAFPAALILTFVPEGKRGLSDITVFYNDEKTHINENGELIVDRGFAPRKTGVIELQPVNVVRVVKTTTPDISGIEAVDSDEPIYLYTIDGNRVGQSLQKDRLGDLPAGLYIVRQGNTARKVIVR